MVSSTEHPPLLKFEIALTLMLLDSKKKMYQEVLYSSSSL